MADHRELRGSIHLYKEYHFILKKSTGPLLDGGPKGEEGQAGLFKALEAKGDADNGDTKGQAVD